jgi:hypothetical protein
LGNPDSVIPIRNPDYRILEYLDTPQKEPGETVKSKADYKEILSPEDFSLFSKLREIRKKLAGDNGLPVYAVRTNEQFGRNRQTKTRHRKRLHEN